MTALAHEQQLPALHRQVQSCQGRWREPTGGGLLRAKTDGTRNCIRLAAADIFDVVDHLCTGAYRLCLSHQQLQLARRRPVCRSHSSLCIVCSCDVIRSHRLQLLLLPGQRRRLALGLGSQPCCCTGCQHLLLHCLHMQLRTSAQRHTALTSSMAAPAGAAHYSGQAPERVHAAGVTGPQAPRICIWIPPHA